MADTKEYLGGPFFPQIGLLLLALIDHFVNKAQCLYDFIGPVTPKPNYQGKNKKIKIYIKEPKSVKSKLEIKPLR